MLWAWDGDWVKALNSNKPTIRKTIFMHTPRRIFVIQSLIGAGALASASLVSAQAPTAAPATVPDTDPQAMALGYKTDGSKTDTQKYPKYAAGQSCSGCILFQGKTGDSAGSCAVFGNKTVSSKGWCSAWTKKA
jgi:High potential iron-sulfur protein